MKQYTERQTIMISKNQKETLKKLKTYKIDVSQFIRIAIKEKIARDYKEIKQPEILKSDCPF